MKEYDRQTSLKRRKLNREPGPLPEEALNGQGTEEETKDLSRKTRENFEDVGNMDVAVESLDDDSNDLIEQLLHQAEKNLAAKESSQKQQTIAPRIRYNLTLFLTPVSIPTNCQNRTLNSVKMEIDFSRITSRTRL